MATLKKQKSGTLFGFIVGLITGLVIAVVVALMVTKTPIPFAARKDKPDNAPTPATVTSPAADPNQSLYGKEIPKPVMAPDTATSQPTLHQDSVEDKNICYLQAGAFRNKSEAENMRGNLALLGFGSHISEVTSGNGSIYRVRLGPYKGNAAALNAQNRLKQHGISTTVTRSTK